MQDFPSIFLRRKFSINEQFLQIFVRIADGIKQTKFLTLAFIKNLYRAHKLNIREIYIFYRLYKLMGE